ncbi:MAG: class I SAM-dependent methyltransferase [Kiritimatiellae bacterium]|nr:class I SAM-dependent methyltransferase [Kiritimatiellia bacterium]MDD5522894.1 class I SAM-dependent methyltransferase [Kiritimatiellia bacterium]
MFQKLTLVVKESLSNPDRKKQLNRDLFSLIARSYDSATPIMSLWRDQVWKRIMVGMLPAVDFPVCVDIACGTGDIIRLLIEKYPHGRIAGIDLTEAMILRARERCCNGTVTFFMQDMCRLGLKDNCADMVTAGYAIRNAPDLEKSLDEIHRVLKPGGTAAFLEFSKPRQWPFGAINCWIMMLWGWMIGLLFHWKPAVHVYIGESMKTFPDRTRLKQILKQHGFDLTQSKLLFLGLAEIVLATKRTKQPS